jgi:hypothetical protein
VVLRLLPASAGGLVAAPRGHGGKSLQDPAGPAWRGFRYIMPVSVGAVGPYRWVARADSFRNRDWPRPDPVRGHRRLATRRRADTGQHAAVEHLEAEGLIQRLIRLAGPVREWILQQEPEADPAALLA